MEQVTTLRGKYVQIKEEYKEHNEGQMSRFFNDENDTFLVVGEFYGVDLFGCRGKKVSELSEPEHHVIVQERGTIMPYLLRAEYFEVV
jgi:hypothetical protein